MQDSELLANMSRYTQTSVKVTNASFTVLMLRVRANRKHRLLWHVHATSRSCKTQTPFTCAKKIGTARQIFDTVPRLPPGGVLVPHYMWDGHVYTSKIESAVP